MKTLRLTLLIVAMLLSGLIATAGNTLSKDANGNYLLTSTDDWEELSTNLETYNGSSFKLTSDISVTTMVGTRELPFSGTFDGQGYTITLSINATTTGKYGGALFRFAKDATFINMNLTGSISTKGNGPSSLACNVYGNIIVENVTSDCDICTDIDDACMSGLVGIVGENYSDIGCDIVFNNCAFTGNIIHTGDAAYENCGGNFVGWKSWGNTSVTINNCYAAPKSISDNDNFSTFIRYRDDNGQSYVNNSYFQSIPGKYTETQGVMKSVEKFESGEVCYLLNANQTTKVWGQQIGTDALPVLTNDASKAVHKVSFLINEQVVKSVFTNSTIGDKMPTGEDFGLTNATFTCNGSDFTSTTSISSDLTVNVTGTAAYTLTLGATTHGSISINNNTCMPGILKKVTATPVDGYVVKAIRVTDASGNMLPVTQVSNASNEYVFAFPKSSVTVNAEFMTGEAEPIRFINGGLTLPSSWRSKNQPWTADTWMIWGDDYNEIDNIIVGTPPADALGHQWYEEGYALTNSDDDVLPNGNQIVWENHAASFCDGGNYDYFEANGAGYDVTGDFYIRRIFTFNTQTVPTKLYLSCSYDDAPVEYYINGTLVYEDQNEESWHDDCYEVELTPDQIALIHTDGTPNVLAVHTSQNWGGYHLDCGLYDPTAFIYEVTGEQTARMLANHFITGDVIIPETMTYNGKTYIVTELEDDATNDCVYLTSMSIPSTITNMGTSVFANDESLVYVKSYVPVYQVFGEKVLVAAPLEATEFNVDDDGNRIWNNAFKFTEQLQTLTLPRSLTYIGYNAFVGCTSLTDIFSYARPVPETEWDAFEGIDKSKITVHVYASALNSYKESWGEEFQYVTIPDPQPITLAINVVEAGSLRSLIDAAAAEKGSTIFDVTGITVTGIINQDDLRTLASMCTGVYALITIDLSESNIEDNYIDYDMFIDKEKLRSITLPETLEYINDNAFHNCDGLTSIDIPASVKRIGGNAFSYCDHLATVTGMEGLSESNSWEVWDVFNGTAITQPVYGGSVFLYMPPLMKGEYEMPAGIKMIAAGSIRNSQLSAIILPASITDIGNDAFADCSNLVDIYCYATTPPICHDGVWDYGVDLDLCLVHVPASAVEDYHNADEWRDFGRIVGIVTGELVDMTINVATAGTLNDALFNAAVAEAQISDKMLIRNLTVTGCLNADDITYLNMLPNTLYNMEMLDMSDATLEGNVITERIFYTTLYKIIKLPAGVTSIANDAFRDSRRLRDITLPAALETIGSYAFAGTGLTNISIPDGVIEMGDRCMQNCSSLTTITLGNGLTSIPECWAEYCDNLEELTIGKLLTSISWRVFCGTNIKHVYCYAKTPPSWNWDSFYDGINSEAVLHTYSNSVTRYQNAEGWKNFTNIVGDLGTYPVFEIAVNVSEMGTFSEALAEAMSIVGCEDMTDIVNLKVTGSINNDDLEYLRDNVGAYLDVLDLGGVTVENNTFGYNALSNCGFEELVLPNTLERLGGWYALNNCVNLKSLHIPSSVTYLGPDFCKGATSLEIVTGGEGIGKIEEWSGMHFANCPNLKSPVILNNYFFRLPESTMGAYEVPENVTTIIADAMWNVKGLTTLILPESVTTIYHNAAGNDANLVDIYCYAVVPPTCDDAWNNDFNKSTCTVHVPVSALEDYLNAEEWRDFEHIVPMAGYELTVDVATPGTFAEALATAMADADITSVYAISKLTVNGSLNDADLEELADIGTKNSIIDIRSDYNIISGKLLIALSTSATSFEFDTSLNTIHDYAFAGCSELTDIYFTNIYKVPSLPAKAFEGEDKSKITLHVYESYLKRFKSIWGEEFQYVTINDPDDLVTIQTGEPLYLFNVDAGLYFAAGNNYGTEASLSKEPMEVKLEDAPEGGYIIKTLNGTDELFIDHDNEHCYVDRMNRELDYYWEFVPNGDGTFLIRMASSNTHGNIPENNPGKYFGRNNLAETRLLSVIDINDPNAQLRWQLVYLSDIVAIDGAPGDVNGDGTVSIADAVSVVSYVLGKPWGYFSFAAADLNNDGDITINDALAIVNIILNNNNNN